jgi:hypothetical protein
MKKVLFTLNLDYPEAITSLTHPTFRTFAQRHGWEFTELTSRRYLDWPVSYEKFQVYDHDWDWAAFIDSDAAIHPEAADWSTLDPNVVWVSDLLNHQVRWIDRPATSLTTFFVVVSKACREVWRPLDMTPAETLAQWLEPAFPESVPASYGTGLFVDDYACSMNAHRFGYPVKKIQGEQVFHQGWLPAKEKVADLAEWIRWCER